MENEELELFDIFTDYKLEIGFEGVAKLIEFKEKGNTFIIYDEPLFTSSVDRPMGKDGSHLPLTKHQEANNEKYAKLLVYFENLQKGLFIHPEIRDLKTNLIKFAEKKNLKKMDKLITSYKFRLINNLSYLNKILEFTNNEIIRFIFQKYIKNWNYSIWIEEKWLVEFIPEQYDINTKLCLYNSPFRTYRKIRKLLCVCPSDEEFNKYISEPDFANTHSKRMKKIKKLKNID
jgi:hypothetical protein